MIADDRARQAHGIDLGFDEFPTPPRSNPQPVTAPGGVSVLLEGKNAVIYGAGGAIGAAVSEAFAREGAQVFMAGRSADPLEEVATRIRGRGGVAHVARLDALDEFAVDAHADEVAANGGSLDIAFNLISFGAVQGTPMAAMAVDDYATPILTLVRSTFLTWRAAARYMATQPSGGVILAFGGEGDPPRGYHLGSLQTAFHAVEAMRRQFSVENGAAGIRVVTLRTGGIPETISGDMPHRDEIAAGIADASLLGAAATLAEVGRVAAFVASDHARSMTAATVNLSAGALLD
jgi:3-oxoacyl-[acyl-carrier protein] reductase